MHESDRALRACAQNPVRISAEAVGERFARKCAHQRQGEKYSPKAKYRVARSALLFGNEAGLRPMKRACNSHIELGSRRGRLPFSRVGTADRPIVLTFSLLYVILNNRNAKTRSARRNHIHET